MLQISDGLLILMFFYCCSWLLYYAGDWFVFLFGVSRRRLLDRSVKVFVFFECTANVSLMSVCRAQLHTITISPCWAQRVGEEH